MSGSHKTRKGAKLGRPAGFIPSSASWAWTPQETGTAAHVTIMIEAWKKSGLVEINNSALRGFGVKLHNQQFERAWEFLIEQGAVHKVGKGRYMTSPGFEGMKRFSEIMDASMKQTEQDIELIRRESKDWSPSRRRKEFLTRLLMLGNVQLSVIYARAMLGGAWLFYTDRLVLQTAHEAGRDIEAMRKLDEKLADSTLEVVRDIISKRVRELG